MMDRWKLLVVWWVASSLGVAGCASQEPAKAPTGPGSSCAAVAANTDRVMAEVNHPKLEPELWPVETEARIRVIVERRCATDRWSAEARDCLARADSEAEIDRCKATITPEQMKALEADYMAIEVP
jgi:hypothetical protein